MTTKRHASQYDLPFDDEPIVAAVVPVAETPSPSPPRVASLPARVAVDEVLGFCPRLLSALPAASTLVCACVAEPARVGIVVFTTARAVYEAHARSWPVFTGTELAAMTLACEHERGSPLALVEWCRRKEHLGSTWRLTAAAALGPVVGRFEPRGWPIGRVLSRLGLVLTEVHVTENGDALPELTTRGVANVAAD
jgi:hypothetical protein